MSKIDRGDAAGMCNLSESPRQNSNLYNLQAALRRLGGDRLLLRELIGLYLEDYEVLVERIEEAADAGDPVGVARNVHSLKGLAANFDAAEVIEAANAASQAVRGGSGEMPTKEIGELSKASDQLAACLQAEMESDHLR